MRRANLDLATIDIRNPVTGTRTRRVRDSETGLPLIIREQDYTPIIDANKRQSTQLDAHQLRAKNLAGGVMVASIPVVQWWELHKRGIAQNPRMLKAWLNRRDARFFRVDDGRKL